LETFKGLKKYTFQVQKSCFAVFTGYICTYSCGSHPPNLFTFGQIMSFVACGAFVVLHATQIHANFNKSCQRRWYNGTLISHFHSPGTHVIPAN